MEEKIIITDKSLKPKISDAYKIIRTNISPLLKNNIKTILITSTKELEGKSTVTVNLGIALAQSNKKVLLIDCNLKNPKIHEFFELCNDRGLTNILKNNECIYKDIINLTDIKNLEILTSGNICTDTSELLGSYNMKALLQEIKNNYDIILLDSCAIEFATDAVVLSTIVEGTILVCESGGVKIENVKKAINALEKVNSKILGVILNDVPKNES